jgi:integrating conjugative element protein (TIGR03759 family)
MKTKMKTNITKMKTNITKMKTNITKMKANITKMKTKIKAKMSPVTFLTALLLISINVTANNTTNNIANNTANNTTNNIANNTANNTTNNTANSTFVKTKINTTKTLLTDFEKQQETKQQQAKMTLKMNHLNLSKEELILSDNLKAMTLEMDSNNTLSSLEILGIFATTPEQKRNYARKFVTAIRNYTTKVLDFQKYVNQAHKDVSGSDSMFDYIPKRKASPTTQKRTTKKRTTKTINLNDCDELCEHDIKTLVRTPLIFPVDLYFKDASNTDIQQWALKMNISRDGVEQGLITLNHAY